MSAAATAPASTTQPSRAGRLLDLVRKLIEYGKELAATLRQHSGPADIAAAIRPFGTSDIALILARITRGLHRANELEARLIRNADRFDAPPGPQRASAIPRRTPATSTKAASPADAALAHLPTPEQIAAEVRRQPIGAVIADICRDLGITPSHPLWPELQLVIIRHGGSFSGLMKDVLDRAFPLPAKARAPRASPAPSRRTTSTGPPGTGRRYH